MTTNGKAHVSTIPELGRVLGLTTQHLYALQKHGRIQRGARGYHVENIKKLLTQRKGASGEREESAKWDKEFRKWRALKVKMEYAEARGFLTNKTDAVQETIRRESEIVRGLRQLQFTLPPKIHNQPYEHWPSIIDQAATEVLESVVNKINQ